jgi:hypothetical protein
MTATSYKLALETQAAERLRERIVAEYGEDADLVRDMIEGSTDIHKLIEWAAHELAAVEGEKEGIDAAIGKMKERLSRHCRKAEAIRGGIQAAMETAELPSLKTPAATLSLRASPPRVEITDLAALPAIFLTQPAPVADKNAIKAALKGGETIPGAVLSNQPPALSVRFT